MEATLSEPAPPCAPLHLEMIDGAPPALTTSLRRLSLVMEMQCLVPFHFLVLCFVQTPRRNLPGAPDRTDLAPGARVASCPVTVYAFWRTGLVLDGALPTSNCIFVL